MKILIANIGSRNIQIPDSDGKFDDIEKVLPNSGKEEFLVDINGNKRADIKKYTKYILDNNLIGPDSERLNVLDETYLSSGFNKVFLFGTLQTNPKFEHTDTYFMAMIIEKLIHELPVFKTLPIEICKFEGNPSSEDELFQAYGPFLKSILATIQSDDFKVTFLDAGGTTQMKQVSKTLLEYYLPSNRIIFDYKTPLDPKIEKGRNQHRKYTILSVIKEFIREFKYDAALRLMEDLEQQGLVEESAVLLIRGLHQRYRFDRAGFKSDFSKPSNPWAREELMKDFKEENLFVNQVPFPNFKKRQELWELAQFTQLQYIQKDYTMLVVAYYRLIEEFGNLAIESADLLLLSGKKAKIKDQSDRKKIIEMYQEKIKDEYPKFNDSWGLPNIYAIVEIEADQNISRFLELVKPTISFFGQNQEKGINLLRNRTFIAHKLQYVSKAMIDDHCPDFLETRLPAIFLALGLDDENIYLRLNKIAFRFLEQEL